MMKKKFFTFIRMLVLPIVLVAIPLALTGCMGDVVDVTVVVKNATDYEIKWVVFQIPQSSGSYSPMNDIVTVADKPLKPGDEREVVISFVDSDFGNSGFALIGLEDNGDSDHLDTAKGGVVLERGTNRFKIEHDGETFVIVTANATEDSKGELIPNGQGSS
jgi:hypothetical protein